MYHLYNACVCMSQQIVAVKAVQKKLLFSEQEKLCVMREVCTVYNIGMYCVSMYAEAKYTAYNWVV
jgi:hypothetical protein